MLKIETRKDRKRGCGWRKEGGLYLVSSGLMRPCGKLPIALIVCPTCGGGIKPSRGWTWINGTALLNGVKCEYENRPKNIYRERNCIICPLSKPPGRVGLLWVGEKFYSTPAKFAREARTQGVCRRIPAVPRDFKVGETWVWLAHRKAISNPDGSFTPGVFNVFCPVAVEYVTKGDETPREVESVIKRGITPVKIEKIGETKKLVEV